MALFKRKQPPVDQVLKLVDQLSAAELAIVRKKVNAKDWNARWRALFAEIDERNKNLPPLSEEEIAAEVDAARKEMRAAAKCDFLVSGNRKDLLDLGSRGTTKIITPAQFVQTIELHL